ncbi:MAG: acyl-ACP--UDP-N-acetylglucosamine O-acyltransferase [Opitutales bacterium]|nr:acyl-ACP--UDP-N-acetylglucosamine O-acyltransferase [Opitutales bacterium]
MNKGIHPSAIIEEGAQLPDDVTVGAYAYIGSQVKMGPGCVVMHHASVEGNTRIGANNTFFPYACIGGRSQDLKFKGSSAGVIMGDNNCFREYATVHEATDLETPTTVGNNNFFLAYTHIAHDCVIGDYVVASNYCGLSGHVHIGNHVIMGGISGVHQFCRVGDYAMVGAMAKVVKDIPPYMIADGNPAQTRTLNKIGLDRHGFNAADIAQIRSLFKVMFKSHLSREQAIEEIEKREDKESPITAKILGFLQGSERGIS